MLEHLPELRRAILLALARHGPLSVHEIAPAVFGSVTTVRTQLLAMLGEDLVAVTDRPIGRGRPKKVFRLTEKGRAHFPDRSGLYATALVRLMSDHCPSALPEALDIIREGTVRVIREQTGLPPGKEAIERTLELAFDDGWGVDGISTDDSLDAVFFHCPVLRLARVFPVLCEVHGRTLSEVAGVPAELKEHLLAVDRYCRFSMRFGFGSE